MPCCSSGIGGGYRSILTICAILFVASRHLPARAAAITSAASGFWSDSFTWPGGVVPAAGDEATVDHTVTLTNAVSGLSSVTVNSGKTLVFTNQSAFLEATNIVVAGTVTHAPCSTNEGGTNRVALRCTNLTVLATGTITAAARGYPGATGIYQIGQGPGGGRGNDPAGGGGHGGEGCNQAAGGAWSGYGLSYGSAAFPTTPGSGGGSSSWSGDKAGHGGGVIWIEALGAAAVSGVISVRGGDAFGGGHEGGGAGGSLYLFAGHLANAPGRLDACGGNARWNGGGGGGGRIAIHYGKAILYTGTNSVAGGVRTGYYAGYNCADGSNGTYVVVFSPPAQGSVFVAR